MTFHSHNEIFQKKIDTFAGGKNYINNAKQRK